MTDEEKQARVLCGIVAFLLTIHWFGWLSIDYLVKVGWFFVVWSVMLWINKVGNRLWVLKSYRLTIKENYRMHRRLNELEFRYREEEKKFKQKQEESE